MNFSSNKDYYAPIILVKFPRDNLFYEDATVQCKYKCANLTNQRAVQ